MARSSLRSSALVGFEPVHGVVYFAPRLVISRRSTTHVPINARMSRRTRSAVLDQSITDPEQHALRRICRTAKSQPSADQSGAIGQTGKVLKDRRHRSR
jgi:hypothetical protein